MTKRIYFLIMSIVILLPIMIVTIIDHGGYDKNLLFFVVPISFLFVFASYKILKKSVYNEKKEINDTKEESVSKYKNIKALIASYLVAIILTAFSSFVTLAVGFAEYSNYIDSYSNIIVICVTLVLMPLALKYIE